MTHRIAVIPGDGAGPEVVAEARKVVEATGVDVASQMIDFLERHAAPGQTRTKGKG